MSATKISEYAQPLSVALKEIDASLQHNYHFHILNLPGQCEEGEWANLSAPVEVTPKITYVPSDSAVLANSTPQQMQMPILACIVRGQACLNLGHSFLRCQPGSFVYLSAEIPFSDAMLLPDEKALLQTGDVVLFHQENLLGEGIKCRLFSRAGHADKNNVPREEAFVRSQFLYRLFAQFEEELRENAGSKTTYNLLRCMILFLLREINKGHVFLPKSYHLQHTGQAPHDPIEFALAYIETHIDSHLTVDLLARQTALSATAFKQMFKQAQGMTFHQHLTSRRLEFAATLLINTDLHIEEIARRVGIKHVQLGNLFKKYQGCSPGVYREKYKP